MFAKINALLILLLSVSTITSGQNALDFDGENDYVQTNYGGIAGSAPRTVEAWIKAPYIPFQHVIVDWGTFATGQRFTLCLIGGFLRAEVSGSGYTGEILLGDSDWHHVAVTYDPIAPEKFKTYVDGELADAFNLPTPVSTGSAVDVMIGRRIDGVNNFEGGIDEVRIWNVVRTPEEIAASYNREYCDLPVGLMAYYQFNQGVAGEDNFSETIAFDETAMSYDGILENFALTGASSNWILGPDLNPSFDSDVFICEGESYTVGGSTYTLDGTYTDILTSEITGCDSTIITHLSVTYPVEYIQDIEVCDGETISVGGSTYAEAGTYTDVLIAEPGGCDSTVITNLTIIEPITASQTISICAGGVFEIGDSEYSETGEYEDVLTSEVTGCDSVVTTILTVDDLIVFEQEVVGCEGEFFIVGENEYGTSGTYTDTLSTELGCDSVVTTNLTIITIDNSITYESGILSAVEDGLEYQWVNCDEGFVSIDGATEQNLTPESTGNYAVIIFNGACLDTSDCINITDLHISHQLANQIRVYPNPANDLVWITSDAFTIEQFELWTLSGKCVMRENIDSKLTLSLDISEIPAGIYAIRLSDHSGQLITLRLIKQ